MASVWLINDWHQTGPGRQRASLEKAGGAWKGGWARRRARLRMCFPSATSSCHYPASNCNSAVSIMSMEVIFSPLHPRPSASTLLLSWLCITTWNQPQFSVLACCHQQKGWTNHDCLNLCIMFYAEKTISTIITEFNSITEYESLMEKVIHYLYKYIVCIFFRDIMFWKTSWFCLNTLYFFLWYHTPHLLCKRQHIIRCVIPPLSSFDTQN